MTDIIKIVLTGGPCAGKTCALNYLKNELESIGEHALILDECAAIMRNEGKTPENTGSYPFHAELFQRQLNAENELIKEAKKLSGRVVLIFDRGLLDSRAYVTADAFAGYAGKLGFTEESIRNRYDAVFHMTTAADGAEGFYKTSEIRTETPQEARETDERILGVWTGTTHLRIIDNSTDFSGKLKRLLKEVLAVLGIPEPLEIERKFLIEMPDLIMLNSMKTARKVPIVQAYFDNEAEGRFRIRKRGEGADAVYIKTMKYKINDLKRIEIEDYISEKEYKNYLVRADGLLGIISKDRYCIAWRSKYYELDVYPFWNDRATLEIELISEDEPYALPDFVKVIREVSSEKQYRNKALAVKYGSLFKNAD